MPAARLVVVLDRSLHPGGSGGLPKCTPSRFSIDKTDFPYLSSYLRRLMSRSRLPSSKTILEAVLPTSDALTVDAEHVEANLLPCNAAVRLQARGTTMSKLSEHKAGGGSWQRSSSSTYPATSARRQSQPQWNNADK